jgi:hypothetical protein
MADDTESGNDSEEPDGDEIEEIRDDEYDETPTPAGPDGEEEPEIRDDEYDEPPVEPYGDDDAEIRGDDRDEQQPGSSGDEGEEIKGDNDGQLETRAADSEDLKRRLANVDNLVAVLDNEVDDLHELTQQRDVSGVSVRVSDLRGRIGEIDDQLQAIEVEDMMGN